MRKALIFVCSFVVSSTLIYMYYYYSNVKKLTHGIVAFADTLPNTWMGPIDITGGKKNFIGSRSIGGADTSWAKPPAMYSLHYDTAYNDGVLDRVNNEISDKFHNHPPIGFRGVNDGEKIFFSYIFNRIVEKEFIPSDTSIAVGSKKVRYFLCGIAKGNTFWKTADGAIHGISIPLHDGGILKVMEASADPVSATAQDATILLPLLDFNIVKLWKPAEAVQFMPAANGYKQIEERVKLKIETVGKATGITAKYILRPPLTFSFFSRGNAKPYLAMRIMDGELLLGE